MTRPQAGRPGPLRGAWFVTLGYLLAAAALVLFVWAWGAGIVVPPVKRRVPLISVLGLPASLGCGLLSYISFHVGWALRSGRPVRAWLLVGLVPLAITLLAALLWLLP